MDQIVREGEAAAVGGAGRSLAFPVTGLHCAGCVARAERAIRAVPGVASATVNLATERARAEIAPDFEAQTLAESLRQAGYPAAEQGFDLAIGGMHCAGCAGRVERALRAVPGVIAAEVNLATERAHVRALDGTTDTPSLADAVRRAGYDAEPAGDAAREATPSPRLQREGWMAALALACAAPLVLPMLLMPFGIHAALPPLAALALASIVQAGFGARFYRGAWQALRAGTASMDTLVALGTSAAFVLSLVELAAGRTTHLYFEASALVIVLVRLGKWLETGARRRAGEAIRALARLRPDRARVRRDGAELEVPTGDLRVGDTLVIRPGERIAADAILREGSGSVDESLLTGESLPVAKAPGARLTGGAINGEARLIAEATAVGAETQLARMVRLIESAQAAKPPLQRRVDRVSAVFVPAVLGIALATLAGWWLTGAGPETAIVNAVSVLVIACPCALGLATPAAILVGTGAAARHGILIRDPAALEQARAIRTVLFDKTGTLTEGRPKLVAFHPAPGIDRDEALALAAALQAGSEHPLARAVLQAAGARAIPAASDVRALPGRGVEGEVAGRRLRLGSARLMREAGVPLGALEPEAEALTRDGRTVSYLAADGVALAVLGFGDRIKPGAAEAVAALRERGIAVGLLSGDRAEAARAAARALGIERVHAEALPEEKARLVAGLQREGAVAMVGDGVNDAAALAGADLGIAMGEGADLAASAAAITLTRGDPRLVPAALDIAARTDRRIRQALFWAFAYNAAGIPLAALGWLSPGLAGGLMAFSSVSVVGSALLLRRWRPAPPR